MTLRPLLLIPALLSVTGCTVAKEQLGLTRRAPDEFAVITRAPLAMPPQLAPTEAAQTQAIVLPVPQPGMARPQETAPAAAAQAAILGTAAPAPGTSATITSSSTAENVLLQRAGAGDSPANIRAVVNKEAVEDTEDNRPVVKRIFSIGKKDDGPATIVDAPGELKRLKDNKQAGQPVTQGDTPTLDD